MTEADIQALLFEHFYTLNEASGKEFLTGENVAAPNVKFEKPSDKRFFVLSFMSDAPTDAAIGFDSQNRFAGVLQIDICTPLDTGEDEANAKYAAIASLFTKGTEIEEILIERVYRADVTAEGDIFRTVVRVEWTADVDKE